MVTISPRWALNAMAIDSNGDPQLAPGIHLRILPSPKLGLPVMPFIIYRLNLGLNASKTILRNDIVWVDSGGNTLVAPFNVTSDNPVTGYFPPEINGVCCWVEVDAQPKTFGGIPIGMSGKTIQNRTIGRLGGAGLRVDALLTTSLGDAILMSKSTPLYQLAASRIERIQISGNGVIMGVKWLDAKSIKAEPKNFWRLLALPVHNSPRYVGLPNAAVLARQRVKRGAPIRTSLYNAPTASSPSMAPTATPVQEVTRISAFEPEVLNWLNILLNDLSHSQSELQTVPANLLDPGNTKRGQISTGCLGAVLNAALDPGMGRWLGLVEFDESPPSATKGDVIAYIISGIWQFDKQNFGKYGDFITSAPLVTLSGTANASKVRKNIDATNMNPDHKEELNCINFSEMKSGRKLPRKIAYSGLEIINLGELSLKTVDLMPYEHPDGVSEILFSSKGLEIILPFQVDYVKLVVAQFGKKPITAFAFDANNKIVNQKNSSNILHTPEALDLKGKEISKIVISGGTGENLLLEICFQSRPSLPSELKGPFIEFFTVACATIGETPDRPTPPTIDDIRNGMWLPLVPPAAKREVIVHSSGIVPGAVMAFANKIGNTIASLNPKDLSGKALPLIPATPSDASSPDSANLYDRTAPPQGISYRVAQADWFGRWSTWTERLAPDGIRPLPPRPTIIVFYNRPAYSTPIPTGTLSGSFQIRVPYPKPEILSPGSNLLSSLQISVDGTVSTVSVPTTTTDELEATIPGPALARCEQRDVEVFGWWVDSQGQASILSETQLVTCVDPRPPSQIVLPNTLQYTSRPDVTGKSRALLTWTVTPPQQRYRVFYADETGLISKLEKMIAASDPNATQAQSILNSFTSNMSAPDRAAVFVTNSSFFTRDMWDQLTGDPIETSGSQITFEHLISGSLRILIFYKVLAVSVSNVDTDFASAPMVPYGIPNTSPPSKPILTLKPDPTASGAQVRLHVIIPPTSAPAKYYRLRRSSATSVDHLLMPIAKTGPIALSTTSSAQEFDVVDTGISNIAPSGTFRYWVKYSWRIEVQGADELGGGPAGEWSLPSDPVNTMLIPALPVPATGITVSAVTSGGVLVTWQHPDPLLGGSMGAYRLDIYRTIPGQQEKLVKSISADALPSAGGRNPDRTGNFQFTDLDTAISGTQYRIVVVDPIGRMSAPSVSGVL